MKQLLKRIRELDAVDFYLFMCGKDSPLNIAGKILILPLLIVIPIVCGFVELFLEKKESE